MTTPATLGTLLRRLIEHLDGAVEQTYIDAGLDYRPRYTPVVRTLLAEGPSTIRALSLHTGVTHSATGQTVNQMERCGLVTLVAGADGNAEEARRIGRTQVSGRQPRFRVYHDRVSGRVRRLSAATAGYGEPWRRKGSGERAGIRGWRFRHPGGHNDLKALGRSAAARQAKRIVQKVAPPPWPLRTEQSLRRPTRPNIASCEAKVGAIHVTWREESVILFCQIQQTTKIVMNVRYKFI